MNPTLHIRLRNRKETQKLAEQRLKKVTTIANKNKISVAEVMRMMIDSYVVINQSIQTDFTNVKFTPIENKVNNYKPTSQKI